MHVIFFLQYLQCRGRLPNFHNIICFLSDFLVCLIVMFELTRFEVELRFFMCICSKIFIILNMSYVVACDNYYMYKLHLLIYYFVKLLFQQQAIYLWAYRDLQFHITMVGISFPRPCRLLSLSWILSNTGVSIPSNVPSSSSQKNLAKDPKQWT